MFTKSITLFRLFGFEVKIDLTWLFLGLLVAWTLAKGVFPSLYPGLEPLTYWLMGLAGVIILVFSIVFHELSHSLVARHYGFPIKGITLFIFGGVAEMDEEPPTAKSEFLMAAAGPASSLVLAAALLGLNHLSVTAHWPVTVVGVTAYLAYINFILAVFNMVPAFPLDGGRILRAALWGWRGDFRWATRIASNIGSGFGFVLVALGVLAFITGNFIAGVWWALIGLFLRAAAGMSYQQLLVVDVLKGAPVRRFMKTLVVTVPPSITVHELVEEYVYKYHYKMFPVVDGRRLLGGIDTERVKAVSREEWDRRQVRDVMYACSAANTVAPGMDAVKAWKLMRGKGHSRLMVAEGDTLLGIVSLRDLMEFLSLKLDLEHRA